MKNKIKNKIKKKNHIEYKIYSVFSTTTWSLILDGKEISLQDIYINSTTISVIPKEIWCDYENKTTCTSNF